jgi:hypothetical protein
MKPRVRFDGEIAMCPVNKSTGATAATLLKELAA